METRTDLQGSLSHHTSLNVLFFRVYTFKTLKVQAGYSVENLREQPCFICHHEWTIPGSC
jgi:hypothetical protein